MVDPVTETTRDPQRSVPDDRPVYGPGNRPQGNASRRKKIGKRKGMKPTGFQNVKCSRIKRNGQQCGQWAILGGKQCYMHGGAAKSQLEAADRRLARMNAEQAMEKLGLGQGRDDVDPAEVMLDAVKAAAYNIRVYEDAIANLRVEQGGHGERDTVALELWGQQTVTIAVNALVQLYNEERDRAVRFAAACRKAGVEERRVQISAEQGRQLAGALRSAATGTLSAVREALAQAGVDMPEEFWSRLSDDDLPRVMIEAVRGVQERRPPEPTPIAQSAADVADAELVEEGE